MKEVTPIIIGFGSLVLIPFFGVLPLLQKLISKAKVFPYFAGFMIVWLFLGPFIVGAGITPIGPYDIPSSDEKREWLSSPLAGFVTSVWLVGLGLGSFLLLITWLYEYTRISRLRKLILKVISITVLIVGIWKFVTMFIIEKAG